MATHLEKIRDIPIAFIPFLCKGLKIENEEGIFIFYNMEDESMSVFIDTSLFLKVKTKVLTKENENWRGPKLREFLSWLKKQNIKTLDDTNRVLRNLGEKEV